eukprot:2111604-Rhodomonas_salina.5
MLLVAVAGKPLTSQTTPSWAACRCSAVIASCRTPSCNTSFFPLHPSIRQPSSPSTPNAVT